MSILPPPASPGDTDGWLFRTAGRRSGTLTESPMWQQDADRMIQRRAKAAKIKTKIVNHTFRATGITASMKNGGKLETAQQIANHESPRHHQALRSARGGNFTR